VTKSWRWLKNEWGRELKCLHGLGVNVGESRHFEDQRVVGSVLLRQTLKNRMERHGIDFCGSGQGRVLGFVTAAVERQGIDFCGSGQGRVLGFVTAAVERQGIF
jgi:hypothetical protein